MPDQVIHATIPGENVRLLAATTTDLVAEACRRHGTSPSVSAALGRTLTGTLLLEMMQKDLERTTVQFSCTGPVGTIVAQSDAAGNVRGYVDNPTATAERFLNDEKINVAGVVGKGMMYVTREAGFEIGLMRDPYRGAVEIVSGEIAMDFAYYLTKSEQIPSGVSLGVFVEATGVTAAGGLIVQLMPGGSDALASELTTRLQAAPHATDMVRAGASPRDMLQTALGNLRIEVLETRQARFACQCSPERALVLLGGLGREALEEMAREGRDEELICHFCNAHYTVGADRIREMLEDGSR